MLNPAAMFQRGVTIIELMITLAIIALALTLGALAYWEWLLNTQIRSTAESMPVGIKLARAEALKRNGAKHDPLTGLDVPAPELFQLMTSTDGSCPLAPPNAQTEANCVVSVEDPCNSCRTYLKFVSGAS